MDEIEDHISDSNCSDDNDDVLEVNYDLPDNLSGDEWNEDEEDDDDDDDLVDKLDDMSNFSKFSIISNHDTYHKVQTIQKQTRPYLTRYEKAKVLGLRAAQIDNGCEPTVSIPKHLIDSRSIAEYEFQQQAIPFMIRRYFVDGTHEDWRLAELVELAGQQV